MYEIMSKQSMFNQITINIMICHELLELRAKEEGITVEDLMDRIDRKTNPDKYKPHGPLYCPALWA